MTPSAPRILVPLDGSPLAELALAEALALSKLPNTEVTLLQVVPPIEEVITIGLQEITLDQQWDLQKEQALRYLRAISARPEWHGVHGSERLPLGQLRRRRVLRYNLRRREQRLPSL